MALALVSSNKNQGGSTAVASGSVTVASVPAGSLVKVFLKYEGLTTTTTIGDGTSTLSAGTEKRHANNDLAGRWFYLLSSVGSGAKTYTVTFGANRAWWALHVYVYSYTGTAALDVEPSGGGSTGTSTAINSGTFSTSGTDEVVSGGHASYGGTASAQKVNGVNADGSQTDTIATGSWYKLETATFTGGAASATNNASIEWVCVALAIKVTASGGGGGTLAVGTGTFTLTGQSVGLRAQRRLAVANGSYALTGQAVAVRRALVMPAAAGSYTLSGQSVALRASRRIALANGSYALNGQTVGLRVTHTLPLSNGAYVLAGQAVRLAAGRRIALANGTYALNGQDVTLTKNSTVGITTMAIAPGSFVLSGQTLALRAARRMAIAAGLFTLTGKDVRVAVAQLNAIDTLLPSRGIVERRFGAIRTRNRPGSVLVDRPQTPDLSLSTGDAWTPADSSGAGLSLSVIADACRIVRTAGLAYAFFAFVLPTTANTAPAAISLPVIARDTFVPVAPVTWSYITIADVTGIVVNGASQFNLYHTDGSPVTNAQLSGKILRGCAIYEAAS